MTCGCGPARTASSWPTCSPEHLHGAYTLTLLLFTMAGALLAVAFSRNVLLGLLLAGVGMWAILRRMPLWQRVA